jgi:AcrR family transcriptional regulator
VLRAALHLFLTEGADAVTPQRIHEESGVARTTVYRHWPGRDRLITAMLRRAIAPLEVAETTGDVGEDLRRAMQALIERFRSRPVRAFLGSLIEWSRHSEEASAVAEEFVRSMLRPFEAAIGNGVASGDLEGDVSELVAELTGPLMMRYVLLGEVPEAADGERAVARFLTAAGVAGSS